MILYMTRTGSAALQAIPNLEYPMHGDWKNGDIVRNTLKWHGDIGWPFTPITIGCPDVTDIEEQWGTV